MDVKDFFYRFLPLESTGQKKDPLRDLTDSCITMREMSGLVATITTGPETISLDTIATAGLKAAITQNIEGKPA